MDEKITPKKKKNRIKFSGIDVMIVLLVVFCVAGLVVRHGLIDKILRKTELSQAEISFTASSVTQEIAGSVKTGDIITIYGADKVGEIKSINKTSAITLVEKGDGTLEQVTDERLRDISGTVTVSGKMTDNGYMLNGDTYIAAGSKIKVTAGTAVFEILITGVHTAG